MRSRLISVLLMLFLFAVLGCGCGSAEPKSEQAPANSKEITDKNKGQVGVDYEQVYGELLDDYYEVITEHSDEYMEIEGTLGVMEVISGREKDEALNSVGYVIEDFSGDGIPELAIVAISEKFYGNTILALYTCIKDDVYYVFEGHARSSYSFLDDGGFLYMGSGGAMYSAFGTCKLSKDGSQLIYDDFYFTAEQIENPEKMEFYHNKTGEWDKSRSEKMANFDEKFVSMQAELESETRYIKVTPFSHYTPSERNGDKPSGNDLPVRVQFAEEALKNYSQYDEFVADTSEAQVGVLFIAERNIKEFKLLSIEIKDVDENGKIIYSAKEIYTPGTLMPERPLLVKMTFFGSMPHYGISYVDDKGNTKTFAVDMSGKDGSLVLPELP